MQLRPLLLKACATLVTLGATLTSALYVTAHLKNPSAPLKPSVLTISASVQPSDVQPVTSTYAS
jgi:multidrug efflux pump subunit AcrA (membrane-fusion protein)